MTIHYFNVKINTNSEVQLYRSKYCSGLVKMMVMAKDCVLKVHNKMVKSLAFMILMEILELLAIDKEKLAYT